MTISELQFAKDIKKLQLREARSKVLAALDVEFIRLLESGSLTSPEIAEVVAKKQVLRDVTSLVDEATTIEQVQAVKLPE
jgi:hypothetical protein